MNIIRPVTHGDLREIEGFSKSHIGLTSLPASRSLLHQRIQRSLDSFAKQVDHPQGELYLFALEDTVRKRLAGICGIAARLGWKEPIYLYRMERERRFSEILKCSHEITLLKPTALKKGPSEICTLYLSDQYRGGGLGRLLSLSRFLFIASHRSRFTDEIVAEMRGVIGDHHYAPFYEAVSRHFFKVSFEEITHQESASTTFIPDLLPPHPLILELLPSEAQEVIGKPHPHTEPALKMLQDEGFSFSGEVHVFDGGPKISAPTSAIRTIAESRKGIVSSLSLKENRPVTHLVCNGRLDFRACLSALYDDGKGGLQIPAQTAQALQLREGDEARYVVLTTQVKPSAATRQQEAHHPR